VKLAFESAPFTWENLLSKAIFQIKFPVCRPSHVNVYWHVQTSSQSVSINQQAVRYTLSLAQSPRR